MRPVGSVAISANPISRYITFAVDKTALGGTPASGWTFNVVLTGQDGFSSDQARSFTPTPGDFSFGVCTPGGTSPVCAVDPATVPKAMDVLTPGGVDQATELDVTAGPVVLHGVTMPVASSDAVTRSAQGTGRPADTYRKRGVPFPHELRQASMQILIVDDSRTMRMLVNRTLRQAGYGGHDMLEAADGVEALDLIQEQPVDLVLCDWNMPRMSGLELLQTLRARDNKVLFGFVTSEGTASMREVAAHEGANFVITKPFTAEIFSSVLGGITLGNAAAGRQGSPDVRHLHTVLDDLMGRPVTVHEADHGDRAGERGDGLALRLRGR